LPPAARSTFSGLAFFMRSLVQYARTSSGDFLTLSFTAAPATAGSATNAAIAKITTRPNISGYPSRRLRRAP
jgi:hypothetical protein